MTDIRADTPQTLAGSKAGWIHFGIAAGVLILAAAGWTLAVDALRIATIKSAVPWPASVEVNDEFRLTSFPERVGPYAYVSEDGVMRGGQKDGVPDGHIKMSHDTMEQLDIGTFSDKKLLPDRQSNWLFAAHYQDTRLPPQHPLRFWRIEVYYYTGGVDLVPHVPEICLEAGGLIPVGTTDMPISVPGTYDPWDDGELTFRRVLFRREMYGRSEPVVTYYLFSLNGRPESQRSVVRLKLASPFVRHAYFAKIQFSPVRVYSAIDPRAADPAAREFVRAMLPPVLEALPRAETIEKLDAEESSGGRDS